MSAASLQFLVVESNPADSYLMVEGFKRAGLTREVTVLEDSEQALDRLNHAELPDVIFLDLNLAPVSGFDVLSEIRGNPTLETIPVIIMSGSSNAEDVRKAYQLRANCFIRKPSDLDQ